MRQHVNPLSHFFQLEKDLPEIPELFENIDLPIHLDIGCGRGHFLLEMAASNSQWNFLGLEIRESLVVGAEKDRVELGLNNVSFLFCNANVSLKNWLRNFGKNKVKRVSIQFPDPWFKQRHRKRRVLTPSFLSLLAANLDTGSELFIQSDVQSIMSEMTSLIDLSKYFNSKFPDSKLSTISNPFPILTEREKYVKKKGLKVYRQLYYRNTNDIK